MSKKTATAYIIFTFHSDLTVLYRNFAFKKRSWSSFNKLQNTFNNRSKTDGNLTYSTHKFLILNCPQTCRDHSCKVIISLSTFNPTMPLDAGWYPIMSWDITSSHTSHHECSTCSDLGRLKSFALVWSWSYLLSLSKEGLDLF